jgi:hypothetical protein
VAVLVVEIEYTLVDLALGQFGHGWPPPFARAS